VAFRVIGGRLLGQQDLGERPVLAVAVGVGGVVDELPEEVGVEGGVEAAENEAEEVAGVPSEQRGPTQQRHVAIRGHRLADQAVQDLAASVIG